MGDTVTVEIPADVKNNSETATDYAFMRHRGPDRGVISTHFRDSNLKAFRTWLSANYDVYTWQAANPNGQDCRFDMVIRKLTGDVVSLTHTEYWTRVGCEYGKTAVWECSSYASHYVKMTGPSWEAPVMAMCDHDIARLRKQYRDDPAVTIRQSERLLVGQH